MKCTVRKIKHRLYGVGSLNNGKWTLLGCAPHNQQLLYTNIKTARKTAKYLNNNNI